MDAPMQATYTMYASSGTLVATIEEALDETDMSQSELLREGTEMWLKENGYLEGDA